ncbi:MAG: MerR family transcriptional regulator [Roseiflexaceae bacterium]
MNEETLYTIGDLAELAGTTPRTIRYYTAEGLLPPPDTRGRYALYGQEHLDRLRLIARLKDAYLPLGEIKLRMEQLSGGEIRHLLADYAGQPAPTPASAAEYITQVLTTSIAPQATPEGPRMLAESASSYGPTKEQPPTGPTPIGFATPAPAPASRAEGAAQSSLLRRLVPQRRQGDAPQPAAPPAPEETWQRVTLAPGVELHMREPLAPGLRERVERLIDQAREQFGDERR